MKKSIFIIIFVLIIIIVSYFLIKNHFSNEYVTNYSEGYEFLKSYEQHFTDGCMSIQGPQGYNNGFSTFQGKETGSQIIDLLDFCISTAQKNSNYPNGVIKINYGQLKEDESDVNVQTISYLDITEEDLQEYIDECNNLKEKIERKHIYRVVFDLSSLATSGIYESLTIQYNENYYGIVPGEEK